MFATYSLAAAATLLSLAAYAAEPDRRASSDVRIVTPVSATCEVTHEGKVVYRLPSTPAVVPASSLTEQSVITCVWQNAAGGQVTGTSNIGSAGFRPVGMGEIIFPAS
ncbi:hypothetical protein C8P66_105125 [Humitalea rosea]|uniref:Uncharacterized protein n=1 Tax=Humitalea rosea TaxID=990373 RepID=A0A2W7J946_9PROT|nr:hypothetical protein [Humitalea rosea]PZW48376.1 hypothetical protein C8P66_105125 [Humitalea rosea]